MLTTGRPASLGLRALPPKSSCGTSDPHHPRPVQEQYAGARGYRAGYVQLAFAEAGASRQLIRDKRLHALAVSSLTRFNSLPEVLTLAEATARPGPRSRIVACAGCTRRDATGDREPPARRDDADREDARSPRPDREPRSHSGRTAVDRGQPALHRVGGKKMGRSHQVARPCRLAISLFRQRVAAGRYRDLERVDDAAQKSE